ncbi:MAG: hypothetical protein J0M02_02325 [Planctomycetes bacterium]|nr:hypothetical protein [Planctomycetota bacterium]
MAGIARPASAGFSVPGSIEGQPAEPTMAFGGSNEGDGHGCGVPGLFLYAIEIDIQYHQDNVIYLGKITVTASP